VKLGEDMMNMNTLRNSAALLTLGVSLTIGEAANTGSGHPLLGPSLYAPTESSLHVWWHTAEEHGTHTVQFGENLAAFAEAKLARQTRYPTVKLEGLVPGRVYHYRVNSGPHVGPIHSFTLPDPKAPFRIGFWSDNQNGWEIFRDQTVPALVRAQPDLLITAGDLVQNGRNYDEWSQQLYGPARDLFRAIPWYPTRGNHDYDRGAELANEMLPLPQSNHWYAKSYGPVRLLVLNTNLREKDQLDWLEREMQKPEWTRAAYRLVVFHHPPYTSLWDNPGYDGEALLRAQAVPLFEKHGADVILNGHAHSYERLDTDRADGRKVHYVILGGAGGALDTIHVHPWPNSRIKRSTHHILTADVDADRMVFEALDTSTGKVFDLFMVEPN
jgi:3',5'-cyclic AMP phosphodiesterase CpdA